MIHNVDDAATAYENHVSTLRQQMEGLTTAQQVPLRAAWMRGPHVTINCILLDVRPGNTSAGNDDPAPHGTRFVVVGALEKGSKTDGWFSSARSTGAVRAFVMEVDQDQGVLILSLKRGSRVQVSGYLRYDDSSYGTDEHGERKTTPRPWLRLSEAHVGA